MITLLGIYVVIGLSVLFGIIIFIIEKIIEIEMKREVCQQCLKRKMTRKHEGYYKLCCKCLKINELVFKIEFNKFKSKKL